MTRVRIGLDGTWVREDSHPYLVALETNKIIDFGTKSKLNKAIAFAPMKKSSDKFKEHKAKVEENSKAVFLRLKWCYGERDL